MNAHGRVAETTGACILMARAGEVTTPPPWEGALESITVDAAESICAALAIRFARRPIERSELMIADEIATCGTLNEITQVTAIDGQPLPREGGLLTAVGRAYLDAVRGIVPLPEMELEALPAAVDAHDG